VSTLQQLGSQPRWAIIIAVEKNKNATTATDSASNQLYCSFQLPCSDNLMAARSNRLWDLNVNARIEPCSDPPYKCWDSFDFSLPFDDAAKLKHHQAAPRSKSCMEAEFQLASGSGRS
jgi:hypothetical protein